MSAVAQPQLVAPSLSARIASSVGLYMLAQVGGIDREGKFTPKGRIYNAHYIQNVMVPALHRVANHEIEALMFLMHPRSVKTFLGTKNFIAWLFGKFPDRNNMAISYNDVLAMGFGADILMRVKSPIHQSVFPDCRLVPRFQGKGFFKTTAGGEFYSAGFGGTITSRGVDGCLVTDDPIKKMEEAESEPVMRTLMETRRSTIFMRLEGASELLCATRWCKDDYVGRLLAEEGEVNEGGRWTVLKLPAEAGENDPLFRKPGEFLWPERHPATWYQARKKKTKTWMALFQQDPQNARGLVFKREWLQFYTKRPRPGQWPTYMICDPAKSKEADKDRTCILVFMATQEKRLVLVDVSLGRYDPDERAKEVIRLCKKWKPARFLYEEYAANNDSYYLNIEMGKAKIRIHPITIGRKGRVSLPKETRIEGLIPDFREGRIWLPAKIVNDEMVPHMGVAVNMAGEDQEPQPIDFCDYFIDHEYAVYAGKKSVEHDDALDAMARIHEPEMAISYPLAPLAAASLADAQRNRSYTPKSWESVW